jgi:hypothetical protein
MDNDEHFYYFAYASNLKTSLLEERIGSKINHYVSGRLPDYGFRFNRRNSDGSARGNILQSESEDVFGVIYQIEEKYRSKLLQSEPGYTLVILPVETEQGNLESFTFLSDSDDENIYPAKEYLQSIIQGAKEHKLPEEYTDFINSMAK